MDSTTLTRTLEIMVRQRWVAKRRGEDRRQWRLSLAASGRVQLRNGTPHWERMQAQLLKKLGSDGWNNLLELSNEVTTAVME